MQDNSGRKQVVSAMAFRMEGGLTFHQDTDSHTLHEMKGLRSRHNHLLKCSTFKQRIVNTNSTPIRELNSKFQILNCKIFENVLLFLFLKTTVACMLKVSISSLLDFNAEENIP